MSHHFDLLCPSLSAICNFGSLRIEQTTLDHPTLTGFAPGRMRFYGSMEIIIGDRFNPELLDRPLEAFWAGWPWTLRIDNAARLSNSINQALTVEFELLYRAPVRPTRRLKIGYFGRSSQARKL